MAKQSFIAVLGAYILTRYILDVAAGASILWCAASAVIFPHAAATAAFMSHCPPGCYRPAAASLAVQADDKKGKDTKKKSAKGKGGFKR